MERTAPEPLLSCQGVDKYFGALAAVRDMTFDVFPGEALGIGGPNGAGKTTLFDVISGLNPATAGSITFDGKAITRATPDRTCQLGMARTFQFNAGFDTLTARENTLIAAYFGRHNRIVPGLGFDRETQQLADEAMAFVGLEEVAHETVQTLPVYHRKLLMVAGALATQPKMLLMDEPVGGLNPQEIDEVMALVRRLKERGLTIMLIEHVMRFLVRLSDRVLIMHHGEKIFEGSASGLVHDKTVVDVYLGEGSSRRLQHMLENQPTPDEGAASQP